MNKSRGQSLIPQNDKGVTASVQKELSLGKGVAERSLSPPGDACEDQAHTCIPETLHSLPLKQDHVSPLSNTTYLRKVC